jgi:hypothetical protein
LQNSSRRIVDVKKGLLRQFPKQIRERILDQTIESYDLRDTIIKLIDRNPKFIIRRYIERGELDDYLEDKDIEYIRGKLNSQLTYEWLYYRFKKSLKENMDKFIKDVADVFAYTILYQDRYEYDESEQKIKNMGKYDIHEYEILDDFLSDYELIMSNSSYSEIEMNTDNTYLDSIAVNYLHDTLKQMLKGIYKDRNIEFVKFFKIDESHELNDRDFEELEYELFEVFDTELPIPDLNNPAGAVENLISEVGKVDAKLLFKLGKEAAKKKKG